jgi:hypothetical protein
MQRKNIILLVFISIILILSLLLPSCKNGTDSNTVNNDSNKSDSINPDLGDSELKNDEISDDLPQKDWGGKEFRILSRTCCDRHVQEVWVESESGDVIDDAVYKRNKIVEDRFNVVIKPTFPIGEEGLCNQVLENAVKAGEDLFDLCMFHEMFGSWSAQKGLCLNWYSLPHLDFEKPWWASWIIKGYTINEKSYLALNDMGTGSITDTACLFFNKDLVNQNSLENPYDFVRTGKWTLDKLAEYIRGFAKDINGDGKMDGNDLYGITGYGGTCFPFMYAADQDVVKITGDGYPEIILNSERMATIFDKCKAMFTSADSSIGGEYWADYDAIAIFKAGRALVTTGWIDLALNDFRAMETDFGIIPFPKFDEEQKEYYTHLTAHGPIMCLPMTISNLEFVGMITEALAAEGYRTVRPAVLDVALKTKQVRDDDSAEMIDIILAGRRSEFGYPYDGWGLAFTLDYLGRGYVLDFMSYFEKTVKTSQKSYVKVIEQFQQFDY